MTSTTESTTNPVLQRSATEWADAWRLEFDTWTNVNAPGAGEIMHQAAQRLHNSGAEMTEALVREHVINPLTGYGYFADAGFAEGTSNARVYDWLMGQIEEGAVDIEVDEEVEVDAKDKAEFESTLEALMPGVAEHSARAWSQFVEVLEYQFSNWKRGKWTCATTSQAFSQFNRRLRRTHGWAVTASVTEVKIRHALDWMRRTVAGEVAPILPVTPNRGDFEKAFSAEVTMEGRNEYYVAVVVARLVPSWRRDGEQPTEERFWEQVKPDLESYLSMEHMEGIDPTQKEALYRISMNLTFGSKFEMDPAEGVVDGETLMQWFLSPYEESGSLQKDAIRNGVLDWFDAVRTEPEALESEGLVESLRRMVISYGFTKFTGKALRSVIRRTLAEVLTLHKGEGISVEEWAARWDRRNTAISYVSGRYGEQHSMCGVLEDACKELGVDPTRKPKHVVRFRGAGLVVEVEVESWHDDSRRLTGAARSRWDSMGEKEREACIVERYATHVPWGDMDVAR